MKYWLVAFFIAVIGTSSYAANKCDTMYPFGKPVVNTTEHVTYLCRQMYVVEHSPNRHTPYWSAEHIVGKEQLADAPRVNAFKADPDLPPNEAARPSDYNEPNYDQGHMAAVGNMHINPAAMLESFYMSNMVPQVAGNNRVGWNQLEYWTRGAALKFKDVYVITGPIYQCNPCATIGKNRVVVPTHLYKIVYEPRQRWVITFIVPNIAFQGKEIPKYISNLGTVQQMTGITFFPTVRAKLIETNQLWNVNLKP